MKKLLLIALLMLALVVTAVACSDDKPADTTIGETTAAPAPGVTTAEPDADTTAEPAPETTVAPAPETTEAPAPETTEAPAPETTEAPAPETTEAPVDPADPVWIIDADGLAAMTNANAATVEKNEAGYASFTATGGDPWFLVCGNIGEMPEYMVIRYRTTTSQSGEFFISEDAGPAGGKSFVFNYENTGEWNLLIFHLPTVAPYMTSSTVGHIRYDFYTGGADEGFLDVAYIAFFNTAEYALAYDFEMYPPYVESDDAGKVANSFDTFYVNGGMYFPEDGGAGDKLTAQGNTIVFGEGEAHDSMVLRGWIGFSQPMASFGYYIDNYKFVYGDFFTATEDGVKAAGGEHASRFEITVPLTALEGGTHKVGFIVKLEDGTVVRLREDLKVVIVPETTDDVINLATGHGAPFSGAPNNYFGQRYDIGETILKKITIADMATYADGNENTWTFKVWQWNTDYATTVAAAPLFEANGENHPDNTTFNMDIPVEKFITGDIYYEIAYLSGKGCFTGWTSDTIIEGLETYVAGQKVDGSYSASFVIGTPVTEEEEPEVIPEHQLQNPPVYIVKAKDMMMTNANQLKYEKMDGFVHFVPQGGDPNFMLFNNQTGSRYAVIKYRTEYQANIQIFLGSTGAGPSDDTVMMEQALISDGEWHLAIFDTNVLVERGVYDGTTAAYLRLDVMESGYVLDDAGQPQKDENGAWLKLPLPEGATIDIAYFAFFETEEKANAFEYAPETPDEPEYYDNLVIPQDQWVISGHCPQLVGKEGHANSGMVAAGGVESGALLHQGSIYLGELDLSKYSKVVIMWGCDNSDVTLGHYNNNANNRIMLLNADMNGTTTPADGTIIAGGTYVLGGWAVQAFEIDLTDVNYNGPVYIGIDTLPGTFALFASVEFIGAEKADEPEAPVVENLVIDMATLGGAGFRADFAAAGYNAPLQLLGYAVTIDLGNIDLSKYSAVKITYGCDGGPGTEANFAAASSLAIGLKSQNTSYGQATDDNFDGDIAHTDMVFSSSGWAGGARDAVVDLTNVDYNGNVWVAVHNPAGTEIAISAIEFIA